MTLQQATEAGCFGRVKKSCEQLQAQKAIGMEYERFLNSPVHFLACFVFYLIQINIINFRFSAEEIKKEKKQKLHKVLLPLLFDPLKKTVFNVKIIEKSIGKVLKAIGLKDTEKFLKKFGYVVKDLGKGLLKNAKKVLKDAGKALEKLGKKLANFAEDIGKGLRDSIKKIGKEAKRLGKKVGRALEKIGKGVEKAAKKVIKELPKAIKKITKKVGDIAKKAGKGVKKVVKKVTKPVVKVVKKVGKGVKKVFRSKSLLPYNRIYHCL